MTNHIVYEYIFLDSKNNFRSKTKVVNGPIKFDKNQLPDIHHIPDWNYDGSSTGQADGTNSEVIIKPIYVCVDPFRRNIKYSYFVLCESYSDEKTPHKNNKRHSCVDRNPCKSYLTS